MKIELLKMPRCSGSRITGRHEFEPRYNLKLSPYAADSIREPDPMQRELVMPLDKEYLYDVCVRCGMTTREPAVTVSVTHDEGSVFADEEVLQWSDYFLPPTWRRRQQETPAPPTTPPSSTPE